MQTAGKEFTPDHLPDITTQQKLLNNKTFPEKYRAQIILALLHFPELINVKIRFEEKRQWFPLASRPNWKTLWKDRNDREYLILLSIESPFFPGDLLFQNLPFNAQIGILGHELCHTVFFLNKKIWKYFLSL